MSIQKPSVSAPKMPVARAVSGKATEEFQALKNNLDEIDSWDASPNDWDKIQIIYPFTGNEQQAKSFLSALQLPVPHIER